MARRAESLVEHFAAVSLQVVDLQLGRFARGCLRKEVFFGLTDNIGHLVFEQPLLLQAIRAFGQGRAFAVERG